MALKLSRIQIAAFILGAAYGIIIRVMLASGTVWDNGSAVMSLGFVVFVPVIMGWLTISGTGNDGQYHWARWIFLPWVTILLADLAMSVTLLEGLICLILAAPITLFSGSIGGLAAGLTRRSQVLRGRVTTLCLALLPLLISAGEVRLQPPLDLRTVHSTITIHASPTIVWDNIKTVPAIDPRELRPTWTHRIGFPLPIEATLDREGVGGIRHATFQGGLLFIETITHWDPGHNLAFTIVADTAHVPSTTLDEHVTIGGRYFDVLNGEYRLETRADGATLLHLTSHQRLNTDFNPYAHLWTDAVMGDLQESILEVVKHRCEAQSKKGAIAAK